MKTKKELQKIYRNKLKQIGCSIQHTGFTCGTCFFGEKPHLNNLHWRVNLYIRGDYPYNDLKNYVKKEDIETLLKEIIKRKA